MPSSKAKIVDTNTNRDFHNIRVRPVNAAHCLRTFMNKNKI